jgi:hypothetical protein
MLRYRREGINNMIKNMTIEQLLQSDVAEEIDEAIYLLLDRLNELNTSDYTIKLAMCRSIGNMDIPMVDYDDREDD